MSVYVSADIGGTFTDFVVHDAVADRTSTFKRFTSYPDRSVALLEGLIEALAPHGGLGALTLFSHGSTVATNTLVELKGARVGLITTRGFRDLLELRRQKRPHLYDLQADKPAPLVPRPLRLEVDERMLHDGRVLRPLDEEGVRAAARALVDAGAEAVVVAYLHAYANPAHERRSRELIAEAAPGLEVTLATDVLPQFREFERLSTAVVNAYVGPVVRRYLGRLAAVLAAAGSASAPLVMKSDGGVATPGEAAATAVATIGSGPAGGVRGATAAARRALAVDGRTGTPALDLITFDMGGTSTDVGLVINGEAAVTDLREVGGWPIKGTAFDIASIGAGGGSVAWVDAGGLLRVGPESAGSTPGPACYGRGGERPTITDANLLLGRLDTLLGGAFALDRARAAEAVERDVAGPLGLALEEACHGILAVAEAHMEQAIRLITVERGHDPRGFVLVAFGGAGPLHAPLVARALGIGRVLVPDDCGVLSALGVMASDLTKELSATRVLPLDGGAGALDDVLAGLRTDARAWCAAQGLAAGAARLRTQVDLRCHGQNFELTVPVGEGALSDAVAPLDLDALAEGFHAAHERRYGYAFWGVPLEAVTYRVRLELPGPGVGGGRSVGPGGAGAAAAGAAAATPPPRSRPVAWRRGEPPEPTPVLRVADVGAIPIAGPLIVERPDATVVVAPGQAVRAAGGGGLWIEAAR